MIDLQLEAKRSAGWSGDAVRFRRRKRKTLTEVTPEAERLLASYDASPRQVAAFLLGEKSALKYARRVGEAS